MITLRQSGKQLQGYAFVITSILLQTLGYLLVFKCLINSATMTALTFVLSAIVFGALTVKRWAYIAKVIQRDIGLFIRFSIYVFVMVAPVFLCEIHGVHPIVYCLIFSAGMAGIAALEKRSAWCALYFFNDRHHTLCWHPHNTLYLIGTAWPYRRPSSPTPLQPLHPNAPSHHQ